MGGVGIERGEFSDQTDHYASENRCNRHVRPRDFELGLTEDPRAILLARPRLRTAPMFLDFEHDSYYYDDRRRYGRFEGARGQIELNSTYVTKRKPAWLVLLKLCGLAIMIAVGFAIAWPILIQTFHPLQCAGLIAGAMCIYTGIAFFVRPEPNPDNMGFLGGVVNDPFQRSDDYNRGLWNMHCTLGPGRYAAETLLDACVLLGIAKGEEILDDAPAPAAVWENAVMSEAEAPPKLETVMLKANRFEE